MAFQLSEVVPWGRNFSEYRRMFRLSDEDLQGRIAGFGDGPASFGAEAAARGYSVTSFDPLYRYSKDAIAARINEVRDVVMLQMRENMDNYIWTEFSGLDDLERARVSAMRTFLDDYNDGLAAGRYIAHELPAAVPARGDAFDLGLSSHFLLLYPSLGEEFHIAAIAEMLRVCREVRIFPVVNLDAEETNLADRVITHFRQVCEAELQDTDYAFQKGANQMLVLRKTDS